MTRATLYETSIDAVLHDLLSEVTVRQVYCNDETVNIEAVYTFPLPLDAVLLDLRVEIGGRLLTGVVVGKSSAEKQYEDAIEAGDSAVMLEAIEPGLYTINVGNLLPKETATITFRYALVYRWVGDALRISIPTTIAPRFGKSPHAPHQVPESSLLVENKFSLKVVVHGSLRDAQFTCPSHMVTLTSLPDRTEIALKQGEAVMDRDLILTVKAPQSTRSFAMSGADGDGTAAIASFQPLFPGLRQPRALNLAIVIDCSGSMQGDSITQARLALDGILRALKPRDRVAIVAFGERTKVLSDRLLPCNEINLAAARQFAAELQADMGGTEISHALDVARAATMDSEQADLFVVTDGEVSAWEGVVGQARHWKRRVFTVGVGSSVTEAFVRQLAEVTGGACELVSPQEGMADRVIRHFERMRAPHAKRVVVHWPDGAQGMTPKQFGAVFEGDTVMASAQFSRAGVAGAVTLEIETDDGDVFRQEVVMSPAAQSAESTDSISTVARLAASARLGEPGPADPANTAVRYQLISDWTNWLVIAERAEGEKAQGIPAIRKVQQTMAAGWSGIGSVMAPDMAAGMETTSEFLISHQALKSPPRASRPTDFPGARMLRKLLTRAPRDRRPKAFRLLLDLIERDPSRLDPHRALELLNDAGLRAECEDLLQRGASLGLDPEVIAAIFLARLVGGPLREFLSPSAQRGAASLQDYAEEWLMRIAASRDLFAQVEQRVHALSATPAGRRSS